MRSKKSRKSRHSHKNKDSKKENDKIQMQKPQQFEDNIDESDRKHKCKKNEFENLSLLEKLFLILLVKKLGLLDEFVEVDEFDTNTKTNENIKNQEDTNFETVEEKGESKFDMDLLDDVSND